jgi:hypothetical protein
MKAKYETLADYLDALDAIKEQVAEETEGMTAKQVKSYFALAPHELHQATGQTVKLRRASRKGSPARG